MSAVAGYFGLKHGVVILSQTELQTLPDDTTLANWRHVLLFLCFLTFEYVDTVGFHFLALGGILSLCETSERLRGLGNVTRVSTDVGVSRKWVKFEFRFSL